MDFSDRNLSRYWVVIGGIYKHFWYFSVIMCGRAKCLRAKGVQIGLNIPQRSSHSKGRNYWSHD